ncbi:hypothetical protein QYF36_008312 [Acer negundo]|nr:hypothetical protein QYF36_008312 [Acer negundo]
MLARFTLECPEYTSLSLLWKANRKLPYDANTVGKIPLYLAAEKGYAEVLEQLLGTCDSPADHGPYDRTALHVAVTRKDEDMVETLLQAGERIHKSKQLDQQRWTPLHFSAHFGYIEIMKKLLNKDKSAAYKVCTEEKTALCVAAGLGKVNIMQELMSTRQECCEMVSGGEWIQILSSFAKLYIFISI